ncbi:MAG TPA: TolC family protein [Proteiniphilum sp.]|nr:TolC family protein [Proteiniphilum sp.]HPJ50527.1 TolC family protein [Proteiniphilum sp.]HPR19722.1 TolC family protein [Proteiniphilum sp.]
MKRSITLLLLLSFTLLLPAQELNTERLTLEETISYALEHAPERIRQKLMVGEAEIRLDEARLQHLPDIYASGDLRRNLIIPSTPVPAHLFDSDASEGELMYLRFNTSWNASAGLNLNYDLFSPEKVHRVGEQKQQLKIQQYDEMISDRELREQIAIAYAECVIAKEQLRYCRQDTSYYALLLRNAGDLYKKEQLSLVEKNEILKAYNESKANFLRAEKIAADSGANLLFLAGAKVTPQTVAALQLEEDIPSLLAKVDQPASTTLTGKELEVMKKSEMVSLAALRTQSAEWKYAPTLSLNGYLGTNYYNNELRLFNDRYWRGNSYLGLSLKIPISQSLITAKEVSRLRLQQRLEEASLLEIRNRQEKERMEEASQLVVLRESYRLSDENLVLSMQNLKAAQMQYEKEYILQQQLLSEQLKAQLAWQNYLQAAYDLFTGLVSMKH